MNGKAARRFLVTAVIGLAVLIPTALHYSKLRWNRTASVPTGLYRIVDSEPERAPQYAALCLPESTLLTAHKAGADFPWGVCPGGVAPLLKPLYRASAADPITFTERGFEVSGRLLNNTAPKSFSHAAKPLDHVAFGVYTAGVWAISDYNPNSFDSRYFGPIPESSIRSYLVPFLLF
jgi:conjugative transfer signal peptidase TraF